MCSIKTLIGQLPPGPMFIAMEKAEQWMMHPNDSPLIMNSLTHLMLTPLLSQLPITGMFLLLLKQLGTENMYIAKNRFRGRWPKRMKSAM